MKSQINRSAIGCVVVTGVILAMIGCKPSVKPQSTTPAVSSIEPSAVRVEPATMVPMPDDIGCTLKGMQIELSVDANGEAKPPRGSVKGITCWIEGNKPVKKDIPLASGTVKEGMLSTKQFGKIEITQGRDISADTLSMAIGSDKLTAFREYLQQ